MSPQCSSEIRKLRIFYRMQNVKMTFKYVLKCISRRYIIGLCLMWLPSGQKTLWCVYMHAFIQLYRIILEYYCNVHTVHVISCKPLEVCRRVCRIYDVFTPFSELRSVGNAPPPLPPPPAAPPPPSPLPPPPYFPPGHFPSFMRAQKSQLWRI